MRRKLNCVMLIDDNEDDNFYHQIILREAGITDNVKVMESGEEALSFLRGTNQVPELIFLDINMPRMNGWEFLDEYQKLQQQRKAEVVIIMLTTSLNPVDRTRSQKISEIKSFESKPLSPDMLEKIMAKYFVKEE